MANIVVKVWYEGRNGETEIRRFNVPVDTDSLYDVIETKISEVFENLENGDFNMFWKDGDSDLVMFSSQEELDHALNEAPDGLLRIVLKDKAGGVSSPDGKLVSGLLGKLKAQRIQQRKEDKERQPPPWMRRCKVAILHGESDSATRQDAPSAIVQDFACRRWRRGHQAREGNCQEECQTTMAHGEGWRGRNMTRGDNSNMTLNWEEKLQRRERRRQAWLQEVQLQNETEGGEGHPRLIPRWMVRRFARETENSRNTVSGNGNQADMNETCPRPIPRWMARRMARENEASQRMSSGDGNQADMNETSPRPVPRWMARRMAREAEVSQEMSSGDGNQATEVEEPGSFRCKNRRFWRQMGEEAVPDEANFASCQRRRLRRLRQEAIMRALASEGIGRSEGMGEGCPARKCAVKSVHFQQKSTDSSVKAGTIGSCNSETNVAETSCNMKMRRGRKFHERMQQRKHGCPLAGEALETSDNIPIWRQRRMAARLGRPCRRDRGQHLCSEDAACSKFRACPIPGRMRRETALTNYRLRTLRRLRRMRQLKALAMSRQAGPGWNGRRSRQPVCPQEAFSTCRKRCTTSPRTNKRALFSLKPYHGFRRFGGQVKARTVCHGQNQYRKPFVMMSQDTAAQRWRRLVQKRQFFNNISQRAQRREMRRGFCRNGFGKLGHVQGHQMRKQTTAGQTCAIRMALRQNGLNRHGNAGCFHGPHMRNEKHAGQKWCPIRMALRQNRHGSLGHHWKQPDMMKPWSKGCSEGMPLRQKRRMMRGNGFGHFGPCARRRYPVYGF